MNILILSKSLHRGGGQGHILMLASKLKEYGHNVIVGSDNLLEKKRFDDLGIPVARLNFMSRNPILLLRTFRDLKALIKNNNIDIVHCHWNITSLYMEILNELGVKTPYIWTQLQYLKPSFIKRRLFFYGKKAIVLMESGRDNLVNDFSVPNENIEEALLGIDFDKYHANENMVSEYKKELGISDEFVVTMLCRFDPAKNHKCTIGALDILVNKEGLNNIKCVICGKGTPKYEEEIKELVVKYGLENNVIYAGYTEPIETLSITDVMVLPSKIDGYAISCLEAFAMRVPVIRTKSGSYYDMKDLCLGFETDNCMDFANAIIQVINRNEHVESMIDKAYEYTKENRTTDQMVKKIEKVYFDVLSIEN